MSDQPPYDHSLNALRAQIDTLQTLPPDQAARAWKTLAAQVEMLCKHIERANPNAAHATLPAMGDIIRALDAVIEELSQSIQE